ncbi:serine/threonine protein kinase [Altericista sp. CCNU0014]|uniref:serine/threonine protein kinase n=1 Tax=Altericista sp. CCNU0014 TaxID=3082949 RepID=UPI00384CA359
MDEHTDPNLGQVLINRYRLIEMIGQGSMGRVYRAEDQLLGGVTVAVKFLSQTLLNAKMKQRFADEARTGAQLGQRSIHIVRVLDYGVHRNEAPFYVMEYMEGQNLSDLILPATLTVDRFLRLARHICLGLQCAHDGIKIDGNICKIVHRDIKPSNVFVISDPGLGEVAKVLDFGIAKLFRDDVEGRQTRSFMGTLAYCSPEQIEGKELDTRSDIYSLGITMFEVLTGKMPIEPDAHTLLSWYKAHRDKPPKRFADVAPRLKLPPGLEDLIMGCMAKTPEKRPQDMVEILKRLEQIRTLKEVPLPDATVPQKPSPPREETVIESVPNHRTTAKSTHVPVIPLPQQRFWSIEQAGWTVPWPADKPIAEIVFPQILASDQEEAVGLWVMLSRSEIQQRLLSTRYNHFLCLMAPHPMLLWVTAIHDSQIGARWLPCYLDLKLEYSQKMLQLFSNQGYYLLLFFATESNSEPANVKTITIAPYQRQLFQEWLTMAKQGISTARPSVSKQILKTEFERIKPSMLKKLEEARAANTPIIF